jgi:hypothetical protein
MSRPNASHTDRGAGSSSPDARPARGEINTAPWGLFESLREELVEGLQCYWATAGRLLEGSGVRLRQTGPAYASRDANLFSALFLYSYGPLGIPRARRVLYVAVNQCLRGMVTGCDNLLDDEYKVTLDTDLPEGGTRFRSVLDIMASDRVLFELLVDACRHGGLTLDQALAASAASLRSLLASGAQEAGEEGGVEARLTPEEVLRSVHHLKTGLLFRCPWAVPSVLEDLRPALLSKTLSALYDIGMGCQILDDLVDLARDLRDGRHNYVASLVYHEGMPEEWPQLRERAETDDETLALGFPSAARTATEKAREFLLKGTRALFAGEPPGLAEAASRLLVQRIGAEPFFPKGTP